MYPRPPHYCEAQDSADDEDKIGIGFKVTFDHGALSRKPKVTFRILRTISDDIESEVEYPHQPELLSARARCRDSPQR